MAKSKERSLSSLIADRRVKKVTSIGHSARTKFKSKNAKRLRKSYRGQG